MVVIEDDGTATVSKVRSDEAVVGELARGPLVFGTTVATNALLERRVAPAALIVDDGFADLVRIGDMSRPSLFEPEVAGPAPLCVRTVEASRARDDDYADVAAVAVALCGSARDPEQEDRIADALPARLHVVRGHEVSPEIGWLARIETALVDAAVTPILHDAVRRDRIPASALAMRSDGSLVDVGDLRAQDAVLSGPAGGVLAVAAIAHDLGFSAAIGLDMGGTSTDVCRVAADEVHTPPRGRLLAGEHIVAGVRLRRPMFEIETIAAGGGSILWSDGRQLGVGPRSAGASPGPQCYGRGGPPTLTDAALVLGLVDPGAFAPPLDRTRVSLPGPADAFVGIAREEMAAAIRRIAIARGVDVADHALVAYGGAAGQHAADVASRVGIRTVLVHPYASVLSAFGQCLARREESAVRAIWRPLGDVAGPLAEWWRALEASLPALGEVEWSCDVRHRGTDDALPIDVAAGLPVAEIHRAIDHGFREAHRRRYGFDRTGELEVVNLRVRVRAPLPALPPAPLDAWGIGDTEIDGPVTVFVPTTSVHVPAGWRARCDRGVLRLEQSSARRRERPTTRTPEGVALWAARFMGVADEAGAVLRRLARSVNIRERLDFSCALFDGDGRLIVNAPHIPVHLGAMGETVRDLFRAIPSPPPGQAWLTNAPDAGGSHLPDLTVVTAVHHHDRRFFVACRGHHVDVGGITPGSMPPFSARLAQEGFVVRHVPLLSGGAVDPAVRAHLVGCRHPDVVLADLEAQIASNAHAARRLAELGPGGLLDAWMQHLRDVAAEAASEAIAALRDGSAEDAIDGIPIRLALRRTPRGLHVDWTGTGGPHPGNLNAPVAVVRAAVLYALRVLVGRPLPLNEGALRDVTITVPRPSILSPPPGAAVAGGNVETSQRLADLFLRAAGRMAASLGTMNNLTLGGEGWSFYETIGGGAGASPLGPGASARQAHMTNTRATDPEVLAERLPLRVRRFEIRRGSGGEGEHAGGDGIVREIEVLAPATASLLATRRDAGAPGLDGGGSGAPGRDMLCRGGRWEPWDGRPTALAPGDRVRVETPGGGGWGRPPSDDGG